MKIRDRYTGRVGESRPVRGRAQVGGGARSSGGASASALVQISARSVEIQSARLLALQAPEVRQELVDEIAGQIRGGAYAVIGIDVVPKMIREHVADGLE